ncbi:methyltransferase domain-containing protein [Candidatus Woesearchaeota archaeon]|nr:methyltransferase domain-containing protein [Candidatus Woesearchaeota archaeon]
MTKDYYTGIAAGYDELHGEEQDAKLKEFLEKAVILPGVALLDVGCGTGRSIRFLKHVKWQGLEPSEGLRLHSHREAERKITEGVAEKLPYPDNMFDVVLSLTALQNFSDAKKGLEEMKRVCKGFMLISYLKKSSKAKDLDKLLKKLFKVESWEGEKDMMYICRDKT